MNYNDKQTISHTHTHVCLSRSELHFFVWYACTHAQLIGPTSMHILLINIHSPLLAFFLLHHQVLSKKTFKIKSVRRFDFVCVYMLRFVDAHEW